MSIRDLRRPVKRRAFGTIVADEVAAQRRAATHSSRCIAFSSPAASSLRVQASEFAIVVVSCSLSSVARQMAVLPACQVPDRAHSAHCCSCTLVLSRSIHIASVCTSLLPSHLVDRILASQTYIYSPSIPILSSIDVSLQNAAASTLPRRFPRTFSCSHSDSSCRHRRVVGKRLWCLRWRLLRCTCSTLHNFMCTR